MIDSKWCSFLDFHSGEAVSFHVDGAALLICRLDDNLYAYDSVCAACGAALAPGRLATDETLSCAACGAVYNLRLAGRREGCAGAGLRPIPLLETESGVRLALEARA